MYPTLQMVDFEPGQIPKLSVTDIVIPPDMDLKS